MSRHGSGGSLQRLAEWGRALHRHRLPALQRGADQRAGVDARHRPAPSPGQRQRQFEANAAAARAGRTALVAEATCAVRITLSMRKSGLLPPGGSCSAHIEPGRGDLLLVQRLDQRRLVRGRSAPGGDIDRGRLHLREVFLADHPLRAGGGRRMHRDDVGARQELRQADRLDPALGHHHPLDKRIVGDGCAGQTAWPARRRRARHGRTR